VKGIPGELFDAWQRPDHKIATGRVIDEQLASDRPKTTTNEIALHSASHVLAHDESEPGGQ